MRLAYTMYCGGGCLSAGLSGEEVAIGASTIARSASPEAYARRGDGCRRATFCGGWPPAAWMPRWATVARPDESWSTIGHGW